MTRALRTIRAHYQAGFQIGYSAGRTAVAQQALIDARQAVPGSHAAADWLDELATLAGQQIRAVGQPPPRQADGYRSDPRQVAHAASPAGWQLRQATGHHTHTQPAALARAVGIADGRTTARWITASHLYHAAREQLGQLRPLVNQLTAGAWLAQAALRWFAAGSGGPTPLPATPAAALHRHLAHLVGDPGPTANPHPRTAHPAVRPHPGVTAARPGQAGDPPGPGRTPPPAATPPPPAPRR